ncbi:MAG TPA: hypothetical protein VF176_02680 [Solirubrobacterales bacterium]
MENENARQSWTLIAIAALGLALGVIALVIAFDAKSAGDDAASQQSVDRVQAELSNLVDKLGIAETTLTGEQKSLESKANKAAQQSKGAVANLSKQVAGLTRQVGALDNRVISTNDRVTSLTKRVNRLSNEVNSANGATNRAANGAKSVP